MQYVDSEFKVHVDNPNGEYRAIDQELFPGKCETFIEGHRYIPPGERWIRDDGKVFRGEMISPWKEYSELAAAQAQYEKDLTEAAAAYQEGVNSAYDQ